MMLERSVLEVGNSTGTATTMIGHVLESRSMVMAEPATSSATAQRAALDRFLREVERKALRMAELGTRNREDAMDLVQEAMLGFVRSYGHKPNAEWAPLFYRVLDSRLLDFHRRQTVRKRWRVWLRPGADADDNAVDPLEQAPTPETLGPPAQAQGQEAISELDRALSLLPPRQRQAFLLRMWEGFDGAMTAGIMGCSEGSVKTHLSRAMHSLRDQLEAYR